MITPDAYRIHRKTLVGVAVGDLSEADIALLRSAQRSRLLLALKAILELAGHPEGGWPHGTPPTRPAAAWALLGTAQRRDPHAVEAVLEDPAVGAWAFQLLRQLAHGVVAAPSDAPSWAGATMLGSLAAAAAIRAGMRCTLRVPARGGRLWLPSLGLTGSVGRGDWAVVGVECGHDGTVVFGDSGSVRMPEDVMTPAEGWSPLPEVGFPMPGSARPTVLDHLSPYRDFRSLRDATELPVSAVEEWRSQFRCAYELLRRTDTRAHRAVASTVRSVVPVEGARGLLVVSASVPDAYGAITMSFTSDAPTMAATLIHEARHQLLTALGDLTPLFVPVREGPEPLYFAPWREDPRPLRGLLYGAHAFAGMTAFWRRRRHAGDPRADFEFALHRWQLRMALVALHNAVGLTEAGGRIVTALTESVAAWWDEPVRGLPARLAELCCRDTRATWRAANLAVDESGADALARRWLSGRPPPAVLPAARMLAGGPTRVRGGGRTWLARLRLADRSAFTKVRAELQAGAALPAGTPQASGADAALVAEEHKEAAAGYRREASAVAACIGIGLAAEAPRTLLVERPELVLALHTALLRREVLPPGPDELAEWLGARLGGQA
ncbi:HEXXH motif domain-containing protein [Streptomyces sp. NPDC026673]|uniref:HEXXH motif domain-containing protein n=1 Tax=Streptomyces sp. NPDC026673 TaxID=3155724 RepID=UPI0033CCD2A1